MLCEVAGGRDLLWTGSFPTCGRSNINGVTGSTKKTARGETDPRNVLGLDLLRSNLKARHLNRSRSFS